MPKHALKNHGAGGGQRHLRVGEEIRHALADIFLRGDCHALELHRVPITVSEVRMSPDLKNATAFVMPLGGQDKELMLEVLRESAPELRTLVAQRVELRHAPRIHFAIDISYDEASRIEKLLRSPEVAKDLNGK
jgi:ribosome-binding factor A